MHANQFPIWLNLVLFVAGAAIVWKGGQTATRHARIVGRRLRVGEAFVGMLLLGFVTSLPEIATTSSAAAIGNAPLAASNLLGGVAMQMALLAVIDGLILRRRSLTTACREPGLLAQAGVLLGLCMMTAMAIGLVVLGVDRGAGVWPVAIAAAYIASLYLLYRRDDGPSGDQKQSRATDVPGNPWLFFSIGAAAVFGGGYVVAESASALAEQTGLSSSLVGASLVAISTSLPEVTTTVTAVRLGAYAMAVGNILGTNALEIALFLPADLLYHESPILLALGPPELAIALVNTALAIVMLRGLWRRDTKVILGFGTDSLMTLILYAFALSVIATAL